MASDSSISSSFSQSVYRSKRKENSLDVDCPNTLALEFSFSSADLGSKHVRINDDDRPIVYKPISYSTPDLTNEEHTQSSRHAHPNLQHSTKICKSTLDVTAYLPKKPVHATLSGSGEWAEGNLSRPRGKSFPSPKAKLPRSKTVELRWFDLLEKFHLRSATELGHSQSKRKNPRHLKSRDDSHLLLASLSKGTFRDDELTAKARSHDDVNERVFFRRHMNYVGNAQKSENPAKFAQKLILVNVSSVDF